MFASRIVAPLIYSEVLGLPEVAAAIDTRLFNSLVVPQGVVLPAGLFYVENAPYGNPAMGSAGNLSIETLRIVLLFMINDASDEAILPAAEAQLYHLHNATFGVPPSGDRPAYYVTFNATGEYPLTSYVEGGEEYRRLGTIYSVEVTTGG